MREAVTLLAARAPKLRSALTAAKRAGHAFVVIDGTLIAIDRLAADRPFYSGKHRKHGMNLQVIASPNGEILWVSGALPGAVHDLNAARIWGIVRQLAAAGFIVLADKGYIGAGDHVITPYRGQNKPASQKAANRAHARLRAPAERANAQLKTWHILRKLRCCPGAPASSPKPSTSFRPAKSPDEKRSQSGKLRSYYTLSRQAMSATALHCGGAASFAMGWSTSSSHSRPPARPSRARSPAAPAPIAGHRDDQWKVDQQHERSYHHRHQLYPI